MLKDLVGTVAVGAVAGSATTVWHLRKPSGAKRWIQGAKAEERTETSLKPLSRRHGWWVAHDRKVPRSNSNLDHVAVPPSGSFLVYLDTKAWHMKSRNGVPAKIRWDDEREQLKYGPFDNTPKMRTVEWQASRLQEETGLKCVPVIVVEGATLIDRGAAVDILRVGDTYLVSADHVFNALASMDSGAPNRRQLSAARRSVESKFAPAVQK